MLRLFRNYLCLATALQLGAAVQAQQHPVSKTEPTKQPVTASVAKKTSVKSVASSPAPVTHSAPTAGKVEVVPNVAKSAKPVLPSAKVTVVSPKSANVELKSATAPKSAKVEAGAATSSESGKAAKIDAKSEKSKEKLVQVKHSSTPRPGLVPPPPPDTPTMFAGDGIFPSGFAVSDYSNPAAIAGRRKDIASQLASAKKLLIDKEQRTKDLKDKAVQFESLFSEGVISRRELESAQKESASAVNELNDAKTQTLALQNAIGRLDDRMKPKSLAASRKNSKGKARASIKTPEKLASSPSSQKDSKAAANDKTSAKIVAGKSAHVNGDSAKQVKSDNASQAQSDSTSQTKSVSESQTKSDSGSQIDSASKTKSDTAAQTKSDSGSLVKNDSSTKTKNNGAAKGSPVIVAPH
jgi:hypothetical protein